MYTINDKNVDMIRKLCGLEMACRAFADVSLDFPNETIKDLIVSGEISRETALANTRMAISELGDIDTLSLLERYASLKNPSYATEWYHRRDDWGRLLYTVPESTEILQRILCHISKDVISELTFSTARYLAAKVVYIDTVIESSVIDEVDVPEPQLSVSDPTLSMWRHLITKEQLSLLHDKTQWSIFDRGSNNCIYTNTTAEETRVMLLANTKPLPVMIARGYWDKSNIENILKLITMSDHTESMLLILYERLCRIWGKNSDIAKQINDRLRYTKILTPEGLLKFFTIEWFPSVPAIHHYILDADDLELERLIDINYRANVGIYDIVGITSPMALRRLCIVALSWMLNYKTEEVQSIRNILHILAHFTANVPWDRDHARVCREALTYTYTRELKIQFTLMSSYPHEYKELLLND